jgi:hypothetical protein
MFMDISEIDFQDEAFADDFLQLQKKEDLNLWEPVIKLLESESVGFIDSVDIITARDEQFFKDAQKYMAAETSEFLDKLTFDFL